MWRFGLFPGAEVMYCVVAQLLGSVLGGRAARLVWGPVVAESSVAYAVLQRGPGWSWLTLFVGETVNMAIIVLTMVIGCSGWW